MTASKNEGAKRGDMALANRCIASGLLGMEAWIAKGNWQNGYGAMFINFRDSTKRYYLRVSAQTDRQVQVRESMTPLRNAENALFLYIKEPRRADKDISLLLRPLNTKLVNAVEYAMIDVNDFMKDMS